MTQTRGNITAKQLQNELVVTYKTAWRMKKMIYKLMEQNNGDLLEKKDQKIFKWTFLNKLELKVVNKQESTEN
jgi:hypothetical protein